MLLQNSELSADDSSDLDMDVEEDIIKALDEVTIAYNF
jgi:hypothetical protein